MKARVLILLLLVTGISGCLKSNDTPIRQGAVSDKNRLQHETLGFIFYADNPFPPIPSVEEIQFVEQLNVSRDTKELTRIFGERTGNHLWVYALRDTDSDGIRDYRIGDDHGRFMEGDTDIDGDNIDNTLDAQPYDRSVGNVDSNQNQIPDHIDWSLNNNGNQSEKKARIQQKLFAKNGVILVKRSTEFTPQLAQVIDDMVSRVFASLYVGRDYLPTLKTIASVQWVSLDAATDDGAKAQVIAQNETLTMWQSGIELNAFLLFGLLGHELAHNYQFSLDYTERDQQELSNNIYRHNNFYRELQPFGWSFEDNDGKGLDEGQIFNLFTPQWQEISPYSMQFDETNVEDLEKLVEDKDLNDPEVVARHIVGTYSLTTPLEWHADSMIAYLFILLEDYAEKHFCTMGEMEELKRLTKDININTWDFYHGNARGNEDLLDYFSEKFPISEENLDYLTREYLLGSFPGTCADF